MVARYAPKNNILGDLMEHFSDRMNGESFIILDEKRHVAGVHRPGFSWFVYRLNMEEYRMFSDAYTEEDTYAALWKIFHCKISIAERENAALQRNNLPLRFRPYMTEFRRG